MVLKVLVKSGSQCRRISPASPEKNINETKQGETEQGQKGQFTRCHFRADILQVYKF